MEKKCITWITKEAPWLFENYALLYFIYFFAFLLKGIFFNRLSSHLYISPIFGVKNKNKIYFVFYPNLQPLLVFLWYLLFSVALVCFLLVVVGRLWRQSLSRRMMRPLSQSREVSGLCRRKWGWEFIFFQVNNENHIQNEVFSSSFLYFLLILSDSFLFFFFGFSIFSELKAKAWEASAKTRHAMGLILRQIKYKY